MRYTVIDTKTIDLSFLDSMSNDERELMEKIFSISGFDSLVIQKTKLKCNNVMWYFIRDGKGRHLIIDLRGNSCLRFSNSKNINRWVCLHDLFSSFNGF